MTATAPKTWVEISAPALRDNARALRRLLRSGTALMAVVKANAYGHGLTNVVDAIAGEVDWFGVDSLDEARRVRACTTAPVLILGATLPENLAAVVHEGFSQVCSTREAVAAMSAAAGAEYPAKVHLKIETGTSRQGIHAYDIPAFLGHVRELPHVRIEGVATHYANIEDTTDDAYAKQQLDHFTGALDVLAAARVEPAIVHTACSAAAILHPNTHFTMVRAGIALYGLWPSAETRAAATTLGREVALTSALTWKTRIMQVKPLAAGTPVSYGLTEHVGRDSRIAVLPIGYWDGYDRGLSSAGNVLVRGKRAKVLGRVCMNMTVVDITDIPDAREGDEVVLLGAQGSDEITAEELADALGTIHYEVVTRINPLLPRLTIPAAS